jgi:hypothetical protein
MVIYFLNKREGRGYEKERGSEMKEKEKENAYLSSSSSMGCGGATVLHTLKGLSCVRVCCMLRVLRVLRVCCVCAACVLRVYCVCAACVLRVLLYCMDLFCVMMCFSYPQNPCVVLVYSPSHHINITDGHLRLPPQRSDHW